MAVVPFSYFRLQRTRRGLSDAYQSGDWLAVRDYDRELGQSLEQAYADPRVDSAVLLDEMEKLLRIYEQLMKAC